MTTAGANPTGQKQDDIRTIFFGQDAVDPRWNGQNNPLGNIITKYFPGAQQFSRARLSLGKIAFYNSWYNISAARGNNTFSYVFPEGNPNVYVTHKVVLTDGSYETMEEINDYLQEAMSGNGDSLIYYDKEEGTSTETFFIKLSTSTNEYAYKLEIDSLPSFVTAGFPNVDGSSPSGYYTGGGVITTANENQLPQFIIPATSAPAGSNTSGQYSFSKTTGFNPGTYGAQGANPPVNFISNFPPQIQYTSVINLACNMVNQGDVNANPNVFYQFVPNAPFGELVAEVPPYPVFVPVGDAVYQYCQISLLDENYNPLQLIDPSCYGFVIVQG